jgi:PAS domain S-box-containing protein
MRRENTNIHQVITADLPDKRLYVFLLEKKNQIRDISKSNISDHAEFLYFEKLCGESFDADHIFSAVQPYIEKAEKAGVNLTVIQDMVWVIRNVSWDNLIKYEKQLTTFCSENGVIYLCVYPDSLDAIIWGISTHPVILFNNTLYKNIYYIPHLQPDSHTHAYFDHIKKIHTIEEQKQKCRALFNSPLEMGYILDTNGLIKEVTPAVNSILGYTPQEIQGQHLTALVHPEDIENVSAFITRAGAAHNEPLKLQLTLQTKKGDTRHGELAAISLHNGAFQGIAGVIRDITEQKGQKKDIEFLADVVENVMEAVVITNAHGGITYANSAACTMFGYTQEELDGELANMLNSENSPVTFQEILTHQKDWEGEMVAIKKNGEKFPIWSKISVLRTEKGNMTALVSVSRDITKQKEAEEKLQRYALLLEMKVREKTRGTETLLKTSYALRSTSNWKEGIEIITRGVVEGLGFDRAAVFFCNEHEQVLECKGHLNMSDKLLKMKISLNDIRYSIVKCIRERKPVVVESGSSDVHLIPGEEAEQFVWVPILFQSVVLGAIGADKNKSKTTIQPEDVDMLELYANQIAEFIERIRVVVEPKVEPQVSTPLKYELEVKEVYLVAGVKPDLAYDMFTDLVKHGFRGFGICRTHPQKIREKYSLERTPIMWLSEIESKHLEHVGPQDIPKLSYLVTEFIKRAQPAVILVEGVEYLMVQNDFNTVLKLLHTLSDYVVTSQSILLVPINPDALPAHQYVMLTRAFAVLEREDH